jgi:hypothetical protein
MSNVKKLMMTAAGGEVVTSDDLFAVHRLSSETTASQDVVNNIDLSTRGGAVFFKSASQTGYWYIYNTDLGPA